MAIENRGAKEPKDLRYRRAFFPDAESLIFETKYKGFVPLPILLRKLLAHLSAAEVRVLMYLYLRASRHGICYPTLEEMVRELGLTSKKNLLPQLKKLEEKKLIAIHNTSSRMFFLIYHPRVAIEHMIKNGQLTKHEVFEINELLQDLNQETLFEFENSPQKPTQ